MESSLLFPSSPKSLAEEAYIQIKTRILNLSYPPGSPLTELKLTKELDMSRSPIRTALKMLEAEGLIVSFHYRSMTVKEITDQDIRELYEIRELLEWEAFKRIFRTGRAEEYSYRIEEKIIRMCAAASDPFAWETADMKMHMEIISIYENERINRFYEANLAEMIRVGLYSLKGGMQIKSANENLKKMVIYMRKNNYDKAFSILKEGHFLPGRDSALKR